MLFHYNADLNKCLLYRWFFGVYCVLLLKLPLIVGLNDDSGLSFFMYYRLFLFLIYSILVSVHKKKALDHIAE